MKRILTAALLLAGATAANAQTPQPASWTTLSFSAAINKSADVAWHRIGGDDWCGIAKFLDVKGCTVTSGKGELGSIRSIDTGTATVLEIAVARCNEPVGAICGNSADSAGLSNAPAIPSTKPKSPTRLTRNAFSPAKIAVGRVYQKPISRYDTTPTASQPKNSCMKLFAITSISIEKVNSEI